VEKIGHEPWFVISQRRDIALEAGTELQFDAQLALETHEPEHAHGFGYVSGLYLFGQKGRAAVFRSMGEQVPNLGSHPEQRVTARVTLGQAIDRLEAGFIHKAGGYFTVREPRLIDISRYPGCRLP
jgi:hypothetical protein